MIDKLRLLFTNLASKSFYPFIRKSDLIAWCSRVGITDDYVTASDLETIYDLCFVFVHELMHKSDPLQQGLQRAGFVEFLVRVAKHKYIDSPAVSTSLFIGHARMTDNGGNIRKHFI